MVKRVNRPFIRGLAAALLLFSTLVPSPFAANTSSVKSVVVELPGVTGLGNNTAFAFNRFVLVAPYAPKGVVQDDGDLSQLDNRFLYVLDTKKSNGNPVQVELKFFDPNDSPASRIYYPSKIAFEPTTSTLFIRGTKFVQTDDGYSPVEVIAYTHLTLDDSGKPLADPYVTPIDILGVGTDTCEEAPLDFGVSQNGKYLVFTNGADLFTYDVHQGYTYRVEIVHPDKFSLEKSSISYLDIDQATNILSVVWNQKSDGGSVSSEISFYKVLDDGVLNLSKRVFAGTFPEDVFLTQGSNILLTRTQTGPDSAWLLTNDGTLYQIDLKSDDVQADLKPVQTFSDLAQTGENQAPNIIRYDPDQRTIIVVQQGYSVQIGRPSNGRKHGIGRPSNGHTLLSAGRLAFVRLNRKSKVTGSSLITRDFADEGGLSNPAPGPATGQWYIATYAGSLLLITIPDDIGSVSATQVGSVGARTERISYLDARSNVVSVNSFETDESGFVGLPGSVEFGKVVDASPLSAAAFTLSRVWNASKVPVKVEPKIRRPCNMR
ncbi:MAG TPA: hypothetical protein VKM94_08085 [Blastocatellia bacterium]|nr:hypothetical protein [Blastocatellia bacterium]